MWAIVRNWSRSTDYRQLTTAPPNGRKRVKGIEATAVLYSFAPEYVASLHSEKR
jgi:hypothetical protein